jgi:hypothetical protein
VTPPQRETALPLAPLVLLPPSNRPTTTTIPTMDPKTDLHPPILSASRVAHFMPPAVPVKRDPEQCPHPVFHQENTTLEADLEKVYACVAKILAASKTPQASQEIAISLEYLKTLPRRIQEDMHDIELFVDEFHHFLLRHTRKLAGGS